MSSSELVRPATMDQRIRWSDLGRRARLWRLAHAAWSIAQLGALADIWRAAITGRHDRRAWMAVAFLLAEGAGLVIGRGNCPMGGRQAEWGDPVPFFELVLPPRAAKAAVPVLAVISFAGIVALVARSTALRRGYVGGGGRHWARTSDLLHVKYPGREARHEVE